ncbi:DUF4381 family protein [Limisphaera sp. 4302-co]|uniref:DUF4381 family protein n=1 Tax=Limisphaera sp. 4302-co TaxID=3400417 RepID=UPI003C1DF47B
MIRATQTVAGATPPGAASAPDIRDIAPPVPVPSVWDRLGWVLLALVVAGMVAALWAFWHRRRRTVPPGPPPEPAHVRARRRLEAALALLEDPKAFCVAVSDTLREYLEERFEFRAPERTTEEFLEELRGTDRLLPDQKDVLGDFLRRCDLVKFARYEPVRSELMELHSVALRLVEETEPVPMTAAPSAIRQARSPDGRGSVR